MKGHHIITSSCSLLRQKRLSLRKVIASSLLQAVFETEKTKFMKGHHIITSLSSLLRQKRQVYERSSYHHLFQHSLQTEKTKFMKQRFKWSVVFISDLFSFDMRSINVPHLKQCSPLREDSQCTQMSYGVRLCIIILQCEVNCGLFTQIISKQN